MSDVTRWWWVRHAPVVPQYTGRLYGQDDVPCDTSDAVSMKVLSGLLPRDAVWITTHLSRTQATARAIADAGDPIPEPIVVRDFAEQYFGQWQGMTWDEMEAWNAQAYREFWKDPWSNSPPGGESFADVVARTKQAIGELTKAHRGRDIVAIAHGGTIRAAMSVALDLAGAPGFSFRFDNLAWTRIEHVEGQVLRGRGSWRVTSVNVPPR